MEHANRKRIPLEFGSTTVAGAPLESIVALLGAVHECKGVWHA
jgi:hypothetical protein